MRGSFVAKLWKTLNKPIVFSKAPSPKQFEPVTVHVPERPIFKARSHPYRSRAEYNAAAAHYAKHGSWPRKRGKPCKHWRYLHAVNQGRGY